MGSDDLHADGVYETGQSSAIKGSRAVRGARGPGDLTASKLRQNKIKNAYLSSD